MTILTQGMIFTLGKIQRKASSSQEWQTSSKTWSSLSWKRSLSSARKRRSTPRSPSSLSIHRTCSSRS